MHQPDEQGNVVVGANHIGIGTTSSFIQGGKRLIATIGLRDIIVIDTKDAVLICARDQAQDVRLVVEQRGKLSQT